MAGEADLRSILRWVLLEMVAMGRREGEEKSERKKRKEKKSRH